MDISQPLSMKALRADAALGARSLARGLVLTAAHHGGQATAIGAISAEAGFYRIGFGL